MDSDREWLDSEYEEQPITSHTFGVNITFSRMSRVISHSFVTHAACVAFSIRSK